MLENGNQDGDDNEKAAPKVEVACQRQNAGWLWHFSNVVIAEVSVIQCQESCE